MSLIRYDICFQQHLAEIAQLVEHWTENPGAGGSIPPLGTISYWIVYEQYT